MKQMPLNGSAKCQAVYDRSRADEGEGSSLDFCPVRTGDGGRGGGGLHHPMEVGCTP